MAHLSGGAGELNSIIERVWKFFSSVKLTLFVLITLALVSVIGTVIQQGEDLRSYYVDYGERWASLIRVLHLNDMYHSWWFTSLIVTLVLNIVTCTIDRFPAKWRMLLSENNAVDPTVIDRLSTSESFNLDSDAKSFREELLRLFKKRRYKVKINEAADGSLSLYAWKGVVGRFGSDVTHVSLFLILLGTIVGSIWGYKDFKNIAVGTEAGVPNSSFSLRLDKFWLEYYDTGEIKQYNSLLTVMEGGKEALTKQIWVNEPLYYKGIRFYQSSYGLSWDRINGAEISLKRLDGGKIDPPVKIMWGETKAFPGTPYSAKLVGYVADFAFDEETKTIYSKTAEAKNPAAQVEIYKNGLPYAKTWLFFNYPGLVQAIPQTRYDLVLTGYSALPYSGISITKDPGTNIVWAGTIVMGVGFMLAFFVYHNRIWVNVKHSSSSGAGEGGFTVKIGGITNKNHLQFEKELKELSGHFRDKALKESRR